MPEHVKICFACLKPLEAGQLVIDDINEGQMHADCCGPEPESYVDGNGDPLKSGDPIPKGYPYVP